MSVTRDKQGRITEVVCHGRAQIISSATKRIAVCRACGTMWRIETGEAIEFSFLGGV